MEITVYVDADAMPKDAMAAILELGPRYGAEVVTVSSIAHQIESSRHITVDAEPQATDMKIVSLVKRGDKAVVVTQDYGLAALVLAKGACALSPKGFEYTNQNIDILLAEREFHAKQRRMSGRSKGPKARSDDDRNAFRRTLTHILERFVAGNPPS